MIRYKVAKSADIEDFVNLRIEFQCCMYNSDDKSQFIGAFSQATEDFFKNCNHTTALAFDGEKAVGCATLCYITVMPTANRLSGKRAHLMNVFVKPEYRRQGIASRLVQMLIENAKERGVTLISLDATENGRPLYKSLGFKDNKKNMSLDL